MARKEKESRFSSCRFNILLCWLSYFGCSFVCDLSAWRRELANVVHTRKQATTRAHTHTHLYVGRCQSQCNIDRFFLDNIAALWIEQMLLASPHRRRSVAAWKGIFFVHQFRIFNIQVAEYEFLRCSAIIISASYTTKTSTIIFMRLVISFPLLRFVFFFAYFLLLARSKAAVLFLIGSVPSTKEI